MVVFFDIDGTIIDERSQIIPESAVRAVERLRENGHIAVVNTGRPFSHIDERVRRMPFSGFACGCGMEVKLADRWLVQQYPTREQRCWAVECARRCKMEAIYETEDGYMMLDGNYTHPWVTDVVMEMRKNGFRVRELEDPEDPRFLKLIAFCVEGSDRAGYIRDMGREFEVIDRGDDMLEMMLKGCSKAAGMQTVLDYLGADKSQALAIGDSANDLTMFALADHTVCMGNGMEVCKQQAEYITDTVLNDGIEKALKHYQLI